MTDNFSYPVPPNSKVSQFFDARPLFYKPLGFKGHPGVDFALPVGTPIKSVFWGEIFDIGFDKGGWGLYVKIIHSDFIALYAHLSQIDVLHDRCITKGQTIAYSGNTGLSSGPHLHFGLLDSNKMNNGYKGYINPLSFLKYKEKDPTGKLKRIQAEINQIQKDSWGRKSLYIHTKYIEQILKE